MKALTLFLVSSLMVVSEVAAAYSDYSTSTPNTNSTNSEDVYNSVRAAFRERSDIDQKWEQYPSVDRLKQPSDFNRNSFTGL